MENLINAADSILRSYSLRLTNNMVDAEDLYQETIYRILKNTDKFEPGTNFNSWAAIIMRNLFINSYRKKVRRETILPITYNKALNTAGSSVENKGEQALYSQQILEMINELPENLSTPFFMTLEGYKYQEISEKLDIPLGTTKSRIFIAKQKLKRMYKRRYVVNS